MFPSPLLAAFRILVLVALVLSSGCSLSSDANEPMDKKEDPPAVAESPPIPTLPGHPTPQQLEWQRSEMYLFVHFGINTFTGDEWGSGGEDPAMFNPENLDADQWARVAKQAGFKGLIFTAKHHEGFALWPTAHSDFSVRRSPWKNGAGDVVREVADACRRAGIQFGIYLSPWDRHEPTYGTPAYDDFFIGQLTELLTEYGPIFEVWLDGAREAGIDFEYDYNRYYDTIRRLQPDALIAISGPDVRWVGNEIGQAPETNWSTVEDTWWYPMECDVPNRPGWFWRANEDALVKSLAEHLRIYFECVGRNANLLLNVPPMANGRFAQRDVERLLELREALDVIFSHDLARLGRASATNVRAGQQSWDAQNAIDGHPETFWATDDGVEAAALEVTFPDTILFNTVVLQEPIRYGQRIAGYAIDVWVHGKWVELHRGTTIGYKKIDRTQAVRTTGVRVRVDAARASPALEAVGLFLNPYMVAEREGSTAVASLPVDLPLN